MSKAKSKPTNSTKKDKRVYYFIVLFGVLGYIYHFYISPKTIGLDYRYTIVVNFIPILIGIISLAYFRKSFLINQYQNNKQIGLRLFLVFWYSFQGVIFSFMSFGLVAKMLWDFTNYTTSKNKITYSVHCPIDRFYFGKNSKIEFLYKHHYEFFYFSKSELNYLADKKEKDFYINLKGKSGYLDSFIVKEWDLKEK